MPVLIPVTPFASVIVAAPAMMIPPVIPVAVVPSARPRGRGEYECCGDCCDPE
jgi:hypothetical protein